MFYLLYYKILIVLRASGLKATSSKGSKKRQKNILIDLLLQCIIKVTQ